MADYSNRYEPKERYEYPEDLVLQAKDLKLADIVRVDGASMSPYETMTVKMLHADTITCFRPYTANAGFSCGGHSGNWVTCYVGIEEIVYPKTSAIQFKVLQRENLD